jgi:hypothetical protein
MPWQAASDFRPNVTLLGTFQGRFSFFRIRSGVGPTNGNLYLLGAPGFRPPKLSIIRTIMRLINDG